MSRSLHNKNVSAINELQGRRGMQNYQKIKHLYYIICIIIYKINAPLSLSSHNARLSLGFIAQNKSSDLNLITVSMLWIYKDENRLLTIYKYSSSPEQLLAVDVLIF
jgi:hypothetical protein